MEKLWPDFKNEQIEKNRTLSILREQAEVLDEQTQGKVKVAFSEMNFMPAKDAAIKMITAVMDKLSSEQEQLEVDLANKKDVRDLFQVTKYKFELYNDSYRYRLFIYNYSEMFPVTIEVDPGIAEDIPYKSGSKIESNEQFIEVIKDIFHSRRVGVVVSRMLHGELETF